ncbi:hypothetical protein Nepgr_028869 [Nepenthes gracilis]|uniref:Crossover junction endonuclease MUS81 n=1 Tax=Nepenthes gracilis TaxID=150966 RepID=A0AAD3TDB4_NEPGR|nr:hypothetical protein Nepgr_028869 [Nepenthes gracilis]
MEYQKPVECPENEALAEHMREIIQEMAQCPERLSENRVSALHKAYSNVCHSKTPIKTLKDFSQINGVGRWIMGLMKGFFNNDAGCSEHEDFLEKGKKTIRDKRYVPQKNSVAYALLITLYRGTANLSEFMRKQDLIDAAEASGLSRVPIAGEKIKGKPGQFRSSSKDWYSGWSCMKTLITKGLVVKSSCPAKYMLTAEGRQAAHECLLRSNMLDNVLKAATREQISDPERQCSVSSEFFVAVAAKEVKQPSGVLSRKNDFCNAPPECLERFTQLGYSKEQTLRAFNEISKSSPDQEISSLWPAVLCHLREDQIYCKPDSQKTLRDPCEESTSYTYIDGQRNDSTSGATSTMSALLRPCASSDSLVEEGSSYGFVTKRDVLRIPPLGFCEKFKDVYEVIMILDDREHFVSRGSKSSKIIDNICSQFKIRLEVRRLPVGDGIWIARHKQLDTEYVLDFIVERKKVDDLRHSLRDNRYQDQKLRLVRLGLKKLIYVVEGDPNSSEAAESIKTACFTTEILEGFDVLRTSGLGDTLRKYGYLTQAIRHYYESHLVEDKCESSRVCPLFNEFLRRCEDLDMMKVSDVFAIQLMQVPHVTEEVAVAVLDLYPTLLSLAHAYSGLDGDILAQEKMLREQSKNVISAVASKNIFQLVWGS